jgi:hypothetical protein
MENRRARLEVGACRGRSRLRSHSSSGATWSCSRGASGIPEPSARAPACRSSGYRPARSNRLLAGPTVRCPLRAWLDVRFAPVQFGRRNWRASQRAKVCMTRKGRCPEPGSSANSKTFRCASAHRDGARAEVREESLRAPAVRSPPRDPRRRQKMCARARRAENRAPRRGHPEPAEICTQSPGTSCDCCGPSSSPARPAVPPPQRSIQSRLDGRTIQDRRNAHAELCAVGDPFGGDPGAGSKEPSEAGESAGGGSGTNRVSTMRLRHRRECSGVTAAASATAPVNNVAASAPCASLHPSAGVLDGHMRTTAFVFSLDRYCTLTLAGRARGFCGISCVR